MLRKARSVESATIQEGDQLFDVDWDSALVGAALFGLLTTFLPEDKPSEGLYHAMIGALLVMVGWTIYLLVAGQPFLGPGLLSIFFARLAYLARKRLREVEKQ